MPFWPQADAAPSPTLAALAFSREMTKRTEEKKNV
jgi:hypothetical protein